MPVKGKFTQRPHGEFFSEVPHVVLTAPDNICPFGHPHKHKIDVLRCQEIYKKLSELKNLALELERENKLYRELGTVLELAALVRDNVS